MCPNTIPIRHSVADLCAVALLEVADGLERARDAESFLAVLEANRRMWCLFDDLVESGNLRVDRSVVGNALRLSGTFSRGPSDEKVAAMGAVNRMAAADLLPGSNLGFVQERVRTAYRESGSRLDIMEWVLDRIGKKRRLPV